MNPEPETIHSFITKIWIDEVAAEIGSARWHGYITHVASGQRQYVKTPDDILVFIDRYLEPCGIKFRVRHTFDAVCAIVRAKAGRLPFLHSRDDE